MILRRKAYKELEAWKRSTSRNVLLVLGARQVGKSFLIRHFGTANYKVFVELNLMSDVPARTALTGARGPQDFITRISVLAGKELTPGKTLIFIDEIQEYPDVLTMAKFLVEDGRFDWIYSGSMLGAAFKGVRSYPVGYVHEMHMHPLDYEEFSWGIGTRDQTLDEVRTACLEETPVADYVHDGLLANYRAYLAVGGMPEVICQFLDSGGDLAAARTVQQQLNRAYSVDISKYAESRSLHVQQIFEALPLQLEKDSQRFMVGQIAPNARFSQYEQDFVWLVNAGVAIRTGLVKEPKTPLRLAASPTRFKLYQSDTGMLLSRYPLSLAQSVYLDTHHSNLGIIYGNAVAQQLVCSGFETHYYMNKKRGEVDFVVGDGDGLVVPIEVKSGPYYRAHAALDNILASEEYGIKHGIVLSRGNVGRNGKVLYLPVYASFCLPDLLASTVKPFKINVHPV